MTKLVGLGVAAAVLCAACSNQTASPAAACSGPPGACTPTSGSTLAATPSPSPTPNLTPVMISEAQNATTVHAARGVTIIVTLHSTYWQVGDGSDVSVVKRIGGPTVSPSPGCVPGQGCGTVVDEYGAVGDGQATLTASRTICGEAMRCLEAQGMFRVTVVVTG